MYSLMSVVLDASVHELEIMQAFHRLLELIINVSTILGPTLLIVGFALWGFSKSTERSAWGIKMAIGGGVILVVAFGLLEAIIGLAEWVSDV